MMMEEVVEVEKGMRGERGWWWRSGARRKSDDGRSTLRK